MAPGTRNRFRLHQDPHRLLRLGKHHRGKTPGKSRGVRDKIEKQELRNIKPRQKLVTV